MTYERMISDLRLAYDGAADMRNGFEVQPWKVEECQRFLDLLRPENAQSLLEIGAGTGVHARFFQEHGMTITATDLSPELVERCRQKGLTAYEMDFLSLDFPDGAFDAMFAMNCLLHVPRADLHRVLQALARPLRPGALFYWGQYAGDDSEYTEEATDYEPKRSFVMLKDETIQAEAARVFDVEDFRTIPVDAERGFFYQALVVRRGAGA